MPTAFLSVIGAILAFDTRANRTRFALEVDPAPLAAAARLSIPLAIMADMREAGRTAWKRGLILVCPDPFVG